VAKHVHEWGIEITNILIKDIVVNKELQDALSSAAKERRLAGKLYIYIRIKDPDSQG
jgi:regulator of protease activity HflC (stomatin/prohibitin superfamily)